MQTTQKGIIALPQSAVTGESYPRPEDFSWEACPLYYDKTQTIFRWLLAGRRT